MIVVLIIVSDNITLPTLNMADKKSCTHFRSGRQKEFAILTSSNFAAFENDFKNVTLTECWRTQRDFKILSGLPPKRGLKYYVALQYQVLSYYGPSRRSRR